MIDNQKIQDMKADSACNSKNLETNLSTKNKFNLLTKK